MVILKIRRIVIACFKETKWRFQKDIDIGKTCYKLWHCEIDKNRKRVVIIVEPELKDKVVKVNRVGIGLLQ